MKKKLLFFIVLCVFYQNIEASLLKMSPSDFKSSLKNAKDLGTSPLAQSVNYTPPPKFLNYTPKNALNGSINNFSPVPIPSTTPKFNNYSLDNRSPFSGSSNQAQIELPVVETPNIHQAHQRLDFSAVSDAPTDEIFGGLPSPVLGHQENNHNFRRSVPVMHYNDNDDDDDDDDAPYVASTRHNTSQLSDSALDVSQHAQADDSLDTNTSNHDQERLDRSVNRSMILPDQKKATFDISSSTKLHINHVAKVMKTNKPNPFDGGHVSGTWKAVTNLYPKMLQIESEHRYSDNTVEFSLLRPSKGFRFTKTEFPATWSVVDITNNVLQVYAFPESFTVNNTNRNNETTSSSVAKVIDMTGTVDGVTLKVIVKRTITFASKQGSTSKEDKNREIAQVRQEAGPNMKQKITDITKKYAKNSTIKVITAINDEIMTAYPWHGAVGAQAASSSLVA